MCLRVLVDGVKALGATHHPNSVPFNCALVSGRSDKDILCMVCQEETNLPDVKTKTRLARVPCYL